MFTGKYGCNLITCSGCQFLCCVTIYQILVIVAEFLKLQICIVSSHISGFMEVFQSLTFPQSIKHPGCLLQ